MQQPEYDYILKIVLIGNTGVGKTQIVNRWCKNTFQQNSASTIGVEFATTMTSYQDKKIKLQLWDCAGSERYHAMLPAYFRGAALIFIVVAANDSKDEKVRQIQYWLTSIKHNGYDKAKIAIIENKIDLLESQPLTNNDLAAFKDQYEYYQALSANQPEHRESLNTPLRLILPQLFPGLATLPSDNLQEKSGSRPAYATTKTNINTLSNIQTNMLLTSLRNLLIHGPINEPDKRYDMKFGGGRLLTIGENITIKVPQHVFVWVNQIDTALTNPHVVKIEALSQLYDDIINNSREKPFKRSSSTHDFYKGSLPGFIEYCVTKTPDGSLEYFSLRENIQQLANHQDVIGDVRNTLINQLEKGALNSAVVPYIPYKVTFFGSKKHQLQGTQDFIDVPRHVASLLNYLINDTASHLLKLIFALDYSIATKFSACTSRERSTQEFYDNLPTFIANTIAEKLKNSNANNHAALPF